MDFADVLREQYEQRFVLNNQSLDFRKPVIPLDLDVRGEGVGVEIPYEDLALLSFCAKWESIFPDFLEEGRGAIAERQEPFVSDEFTIYYYKLKGTGSRKGRVVVPPQTEFYTTLHHNNPHILIHTGIADDGSFMPVVDPPKPWGGLSPGRGKREFENASLLLRHGVPAVLPIRWGTYKGITFDDGRNKGNVEFVFLGSPVKALHRVGEFFEPRGAKFNPNLVALIERKFEYFDPRKIPVLALRTVCDVTHTYGISLSGFHSAGLLRFAGHSGNYAYDEEKQVAVLHDLDSSISQFECHPNVVGLSRIRDVESALFGLFHSYFHSRMYVHVDAETRRRHNPFKSFLRGYFDKSGDCFSESLLTFFETEMNKQQRIETEREYMLWFSRMSERLQAFIIRGLMPVYNESSVAREFGLPYGPEEFDKQYAAYLVKRREASMKANFNIFSKGHF